MRTIVEGQVMSFVGFETDILLVISVLIAVVPWAGS